jgi:serine/threonine protein kinase
VHPIVPPVEAGLAIIRPVKDITADAGETVMFECHVIGPLDTDVDWLADGKLIQPALLNCKMHFDGKRCRLLLNSVHEDDSGMYTCKLTSAKGELFTALSPTSLVLFISRVLQEESYTSFSFTLVD